jgi:tetratricopeptide (TPR) repeat protein
MRCTMAVVLLCAVMCSNPAFGQEQNLTPNRPSRTVDSVWVHFSDPDQPATVSVEQLQMPNAARKEFDRALAAFRSGDLRRAANHLEKGLAVAPNLSLQHNTLGVLYMYLHERDRALAEFEKALALNADFRLAMDNAAVVLSVEHRYREAEEMARRALTLEPQALSSQYLLAGILVSEGRNADEAAALLAKTRTRYVRAWLFLAKLADARGEKMEVVQDLQNYLQSPSALTRPLAQCWLEDVQKRQRAGASVDIPTAVSDQPEPPSPSPSS